MGIILVGHVAVDELSRRALAAHSLEEVAESHLRVGRQLLLEGHKLAHFLERRDAVAAPLFMIGHAEHQYAGFGKGLTQVPHNLFHALCIVLDGAPGVALYGHVKALVHDNKVVGAQPCEVGERRLRNILQRHTA